MRHVVYIAGLNLSGLWSKKPLKAKSGDGGWWDSSGNILVKKIGEHKQSSLITFASESKEEVQIWINGVSAAFTLLQAWIK